MSIQSKNENGSFGSFAEYWADGDWAPHVKMLHTGKRNTHALALLEQPAGAFPDPAMPEFHIQLVQRGNANLRMSFEGAEVRTQLNAGALFMAPANTKVDYEVDGPQKFVSLAINKALADRFRDQADIDLPKDFGQLHAQKFHDPIVEALMLRMLDQALLEHPTSDLFLDQATNTILTTLLCRSEIIPVIEEAPIVLSDDDLAKVSEMIEEQLDESFSVADLARLTSLSDWHFGRAFKNSTGLSPHQYVMRRRIARAKEMLGSSKMSIAQIAYACGFASQSHLNDVFKKKVGTTPRIYRMERRN
ncbi:AraC family transcriptional regulator [Sulfitobacter sp. S190]|uniref:AraC family transcriptional regulator n=1 Tax=Sulfitobacter sp. S190 TaxID=2867022 RepID=UPI0021A97442|nr:AraC family transcriptional regulator [Sulfitobacter sp. S190]UWR21246.1 AraC family transcriptional regulator [Sulfitobacter sp. S190]